jgi:hypothetical protein
MGAKRVINGVHVVPMGMANAFLIEGDRRPRKPCPRTPTGFLSMDCK